MSVEAKIGARIQENFLVSAAKRYKEDHKYNIPVILHKLTGDISSCIGVLRSFVKIDTTAFEKQVDMTLKVSCTGDQLYALQELFQQIDFSHSGAHQIFKENASRQVSGILSEINLFFSSTDRESDNSESLGESSPDSEVVS